MLFAPLLVVLVGLCLAAPLWAEHLAHTGPLTNHLTDTIRRGDHRVDVVGLDGVPIGPTWHGRFFLGADPNGRDVMVRLLYGGRDSLMIGFGAALLTTVVSIPLGVLAGYRGGRADATVGGALDVIWAFPVVLLGVALGTALALGGVRIGPVTISGDSPLIPTFIIGVVYIPYLARPVRGETLALRQQPFVEAARALGSSPLRIMRREILPNLETTILAFAPLLVANAILLEAALSYLGAGVRPPQPSWGTMISDGVARIATAPHLAIAPGVMLLLTVLSLNVLAEALRRALDRKAPSTSLEH
jgi:peptide/nickel transport system permease protein